MNSDVQESLKILQRQPFERLSIKQLESISLTEHVPMGLLELLAKHPEPRYRTIAVSHPASSADVLSLFVSDVDPDMRLQVAKHAHATAPILETLASDQDSTVAACAAANPLTPTHALYQLCHHQDAWVRLNLATNSSIPHDLQMSLYKQAHKANEPGVLCSLAEEAHLPDSLFATFANGAITYRTRVAKNRYCPATIFKKLMVDPSQQVRAACCTNPQITLVEQVAIMDTLDNARELETLACSQVILPEALLAALFNTGLRSVQQAMSIRADITPAIVDMLCASDDEVVRANLAGSLKVPFKLIEALSTDRSLLVKVAIAGRPDCPSSVMESFLGDDAKVALAMAKNSHAPSHILDELSGHQDFMVRGAVAANPGTPIYVLEVLSLDDSVVVLNNLATNESTPTKTLLTLINNNPDSYLAVVLVPMNFDKPYTTLRKEINAGLTLDTRLTTKVDACSVGDSLLAAGMANLYQRIQAITLELQITSATSEQQNVTSSYKLRF